MFFHLKNSLLRPNLFAACILSSSLATAGGGASKIDSPSEDRQHSYKSENSQNLDHATAHENEVKIELEDDRKDLPAYRLNRPATPRPGFIENGMFPLGVMDDLDFTPRTPAPSPRRQRRGGNDHPVQAAVNSSIKREGGLSRSPAMGEIPDILVDPSNPCCLLASFKYQDERVAKALHLASELFSLINANSVFSLLNELHVELKLNLLQKLEDKIRTNTEIKSYPDTFKAYSNHLTIKALDDLNLNNEDLLSLLSRILNTDLNQEKWFDKITFLDMIKLQRCIEFSLSKPDDLQCVSDAIQFLKYWSKKEPISLAAFLNLPDFRMRMQPLLFKATTEEQVDMLSLLGAEQRIMDINGKLYFEDGKITRIYEQRAPFLEATYELLDGGV